MADPVLLQNHYFYGPAGTDITKSAWNGRSLAVDHDGRDTQYDHEYLLFYEI